MQAPRITWLVCRFPLDFYARIPSVCDDTLLQAMRSTTLAPIDAYCTYVLYVAMHGDDE